MAPWLLLSLANVAITIHIRAAESAASRWVTCVPAGCWCHPFHHPQLLPRPSAPTRDCPTDFLPWMSHCSQDQSHQPATSHGLGAHFTSSVKRRPGKRKTQIMATTTFDMTRKRQRLEADLAAILSTSTELHMILEEGSGLMNSGGQNIVKDEFKAEVEVEGLSGGEPFNLSGNLEELGGLNYGSYQTHPQDFTSDNNISERPMKETQKCITPESRPGDHNSLREVESCPPSSSGQNSSLHNFFCWSRYSTSRFRAPRHLLFSNFFAR